MPEGVAPRANCDNKACGLEPDEILRDGMNVERALKSLHRARLSYCVLDVIELRVQA